MQGQEGEMQGAKGPKKTKENFFMITLRSWCSISAVSISQLQLLGRNTEVEVVQVQGRRPPHHHTQQLHNHKHKLIV
jgi:hypothetical protein